MSNGKFEEICNHYFGDGTPVEVTSAALDTGKNQLIVATNAGFEPFEYTKGDKYLGIDMEIAAALAAYLGQELVISNMDFDAVCLSVDQQKCDIDMATVAKLLITLEIRAFEAIRRHFDTRFDTRNSGFDTFFEPRITASKD